MLDSRVRPPALARAVSDLMGRSMPERAGEGDMTQVENSAGEGNHAHIKPHSGSVIEEP